VLNQYLWPVALTWGGGQLPPPWILGCRKIFLVRKYSSKTVKFEAEKSLFWGKFRCISETLSTYNLLFHKFADVCRNSVRNFQRPSELHALPIFFNPQYCCLRCACHVCTSSLFDEIKCWIISMYAIYCI